MTAKSAAKAEAATEENTVFVYKFDGDDYKFDRNDTDDVEILEAFEDGRMVTALRAILGPAQWATFKSKKRTSEDLNNMAEAMFKAVGATTGESSG